MRTHHLKQIRVSNVAVVVTHRLTQWNKQEFNVKCIDI